MDVNAGRLQQVAGGRVERERQGVASSPEAFVRALVTIARRRRTLGNDWQALCAEVRRTGGLAVGQTTEEIVEQVRKTREEIFAVEYTHLYR